MSGEIVDGVMFACGEQQQVNRARLIPVIAYQTPMLAVCLQGISQPYMNYWSEVFLYNADTGQRHPPLPILATSQEFMASPGPGLVSGLSFVIPGQHVGLPAQTQAVVSANLAFPTPIYSYPVPVPAVKKIRFEEAVDLHGLGLTGVALASPSRPPMIRDYGHGDGWRMLSGSLRPHRLHAARPNHLIGLGTTSTGAAAAVVWSINSPHVLHAFGGRKDVRHVAVSTSGELVAIAAPDGVSVHRVTGEEMTGRLPTDGPLEAVLLDDSGAGIHVVCVTRNGIKLWDAARSVIVGDFPSPDEPVLEAQFAPTIHGPKVALATPKRVVIRHLG